MPLREPWVTLRLSPQTLPACIYSLDTLNQFSMCQALLNRAKTGLSIHNIGCFGMKVGSARLRDPSRPAVLAKCLGQMATCGKITGTPDSECIYVTNCAASHAHITSQQKNHFHCRTFRGCIVEIWYDGKTPQTLKHQQTDCCVLPTLLSIKYVCMNMLISMIDII